MRDPIVFDCEAVAIDAAGEFLEPVDAPANYKDPAKIEAYQKEKQAELLARCSLDPDLARILTIGTSIGSHEQVAVCLTDADEAVALEQFWDLVRPYPFPRLVGYNCLGYDLPLMLRRSLYLGVKVPPLQIGKYRHPDVDDLMMILSFDGAIKFRGLAFYCKRFGIDVPDEHKGKDVAALAAAGDISAVRAHCLADIRRTRLLGERIGILEPVAIAV
jgi:hypothetical protein